MMPFLRPDDLVKLRPVSVGSLHRGDVIVVRYASGPVTHRLVWVDAQGWHTKGDHCALADLPVSAEAILGRVVSVERGAARLDLQNRRWSLVNRCVGALAYWETQIRQRLGSTRLAGRPLFARMATWPLRVLAWLVLEWSLRV
jgi:hypothetical protein